MRMPYSTFVVVPALAVGSMYVKDGAGVHEVRALLLLRVGHQSRWRTGVPNEAIKRPVEDKIGSAMLEGISEATERQAAKQMQLDLQNKLQELRLVPMALPWRAPANRGQRAPKCQYYGLVLHWS